MSSLLGFERVGQEVRQFDGKVSTTNVKDWQHRILNQSHFSTLPRQLKR